MSGEATRLLRAINAGDDRAAAELLPLLYTELRRLAEARMRRLPPGQTLQATALVHEAYLRLIGEEDPGWNGRGHFFGAAAQAMRDILVEQARRKSRKKHGGDLVRRELGDEAPADLDFDIAPEDLLAVNDALDRMKELHPRPAEVVMYRYFAGLSSDVIGDLLGVSGRTIERDWRFARAWLHRAIESSAPGEDEPDA